MPNLRLPFDDAEPSVASIDARDRAARLRAVDPRFNVALEASAGTGKTRVLVDRYVNLLREGVDPANVLAITFTRKASSEMRERILASLRSAAERGEIAAARWRELRDRSGDIAISTIDAFCLSLLREFPLEADLDPGFSLADDTEVPRLIDESLDRALRVCRALAAEDEHVGLVFAQLGDRRARAGLAALLSRRLVAPAVLSRYLVRGPQQLTVASASLGAASALLDLFAGMRGGLERFFDTGPPEPGFVLLQRQIQRLAAAVTGVHAVESGFVQTVFAGVREHFLTQEGEPRSRLLYAKAQFATAADFQTHRQLVLETAPAVRAVQAAYRRDLNVLVARGVRRMFAIAESEYRRTLEAHAVLDFSDVLERALQLLRQMEEFSQSRYRLEARYHHVLVDEFQDTSRAQWELVSLLIQSWGEGAGLSHAGPLHPSIFIVGDRKQSIYGFRDADVAILREAGRHLETLRPGGNVRRSISRSFRSVPSLLAFINDVCQELTTPDARPDAFRYDEEDRFPIDSGGTGQEGESLGVVVGDTSEHCAEATAEEIQALLAAGTTVRDVKTGVRRPVRPGDIGILFRTRESHREFEEALERRGIPAFVYKGLGFFDADEIKDVSALLWYLADPLSDLRAAAWLRSRFVHMSDEGLRRLAPRLALALSSSQTPAAAASLDPADGHALSLARAGAARWRQLVDRVPPAELLDIVLDESAYSMELRGPRLAQARENLKKVRGMIRRIQNRGYATLGRIAAHLDRLAVGDESNAVIDALDAVNLMTVHAAKGLEFPVVFVVNLARGTGNRRDAIRVAGDADGESVSVAVGDFRSEADEDEMRREREETKRLVYVAFTRARDRLYLASALKEGRIQPGRGSLGEVLPVSLLDALSGAHGGEARVSWHPRPDARHVFRACRHRAAVAAPPATFPPPAVHGPQVSCDFAALPDSVVPRETVLQTTGAQAGTRQGTVGGPSTSRLAGTLVHRLLQRHGLAADPTPHSVQRILRGEERVDVLEEAGLIEDVLAIYRRVSGRPDVQELYRSGEVLHEVPFTMLRQGRFVRGAIDCVVRSGDRVTVLEFKTGRRHASHEAQAALYREAVAALFPGSVVESRLVYAEDEPSP